MFSLRELIKITILKLEKLVESLKEDKKWFDDRKENAWWFVYHVTA